MLNNGIVILAIRHAYYGRFAYNLAVTIRALDPVIPIALIHDRSGIAHLSERQRAVFSHFIPIETDEKKTAFAYKLHVYDLSPFRHTLFLDSDMAWFPKKQPGELFEKLREVDFTAITEGYYDIGTKDDSNLSKEYYLWGNGAEIAEVYGLKEGRIYQWRSEVMYFRRCARARSMFRRAQKIYDNPRLKNIVSFGGGVADELAINVSCACAGIHPHRYKWLPAYWTHRHRFNMPDLPWLYENYFLLSCGSNYATGSLKHTYDRVVKSASNKIGHQYLFPLVSKREFLPERKKR